MESVHKSSQVALCGVIQLVHISSLSTPAFLKDAGQHLPSLDSGSGSLGAGNGLAQTTAKQFQQAGIPPACSDRRLLAAPSLKLQEDVDNCRRNSFEIIPFPCLTFPVHLTRAQRCLIVPSSPQAFRMEGSVVSVRVWRCKIGRELI